MTERERSRNLWLERAGWVLFAGLAGWGFTAFVGLHPRPLLLAAVIAAAFAVGWVFTDLAADIDRIDFAAPRRRVAARHGLDPRFLQTARLLRDEDRQLVSTRVHRDLVRVIDDRLTAHHGVVREAEPERARGVLGPELSAYVDQGPHPRQLHPRQLSALLTRIEAL
jgi:hypothetical protein